MHKTDDGVPRRSQHCELPTGWRGRPVLDEAVRAVPAKAATHVPASRAAEKWTPAFAGEASGGAARVGPAMPHIWSRHRWPDRPATGLSFDQAETRAGRRLRYGVAFSNASATRNRVGSWKGLATSWIATGRSPAPNPAHTEIAG
jgi:hypothetical protein